MYVKICPDWWFTRKAHLTEGNGGKNLGCKERKLNMKQYAKQRATFLCGFCLSSFPVFLLWRRMMWNCKPNKSFSPELICDQVLITSTEKQTRTASVNITVYMKHMEKMWLWISLQWLLLLGKSHHVVSTRFPNSRANHEMNTQYFTSLHSLFYILL